VLNKRDYAHGADAIAWLEQAIRLDPAFARGESQLGLAQIVLRPLSAANLAAAERHARAAMAADPTAAQPVYVMGLARRYQRRFAEAEPYLERAVAMAPGDASAHMYLGQWLIAVGYTRAGIATLDRALAIDPLLPNAANWRGYQLLYAGDVAGAKALFERTDALGLSLARGGLGEVALVQGDVARARQLMAPLPSSLTVPCLAHPDTEFPELLAGTLRGDAAQRARAVAIVDECLATRPAPTPAWTVISLIRLGNYPRALALLATGPTSDDAGLAFRIWAPAGAPIRQLPGFAEAARRIGWVDAWEKYGAPDTCTRVAPREYACR
jgi:tetratricopeptide (TPR) repeat protein